MALAVYYIEQTQISEIDLSNLDISTIVFSDDHKSGLRLF